MREFSGLFVHAADALEKQGLDGMDGVLREFEEPYRAEIRRQEAGRFNQPSVTGCGVLGSTLTGAGAVSTVVFLNASGQIGSVTVSNQGQGYSVPPVFKLNGRIDPPPESCIQETRSNNMAQKRPSFIQRLFRGPT